MACHPADPGCFGGRADRAAGLRDACGSLPVDVSSLVPSSGQVLVRQDVTWTTDSGLTTIKSTPQFVYATSNEISLAPPPLQGQGDQKYFFLEHDGPADKPLCGVTSTTGRG